MVCIEHECVRRGDFARVRVFGVEIRYRAPGMQHVAMEIIRQTLARDVQRRDMLDDLPRQWEGAARLEKRAMEEGGRGHGDSALERGEEGEIEDGEEGLAGEV